MACIPLRIKANIFTIVYEALHNQAPIISLTSSLTGLLFIHSTTATLPPCCFSNTPAILIPQCFCTCYSFLPETLFPRRQPRSLPYLLYVFTQCLCLGETLPIRSRQTPTTLPTLHIFYVSLLSIALPSI